MNGHSESFVGTLKREYLDHFIISSTEHMDRLCQRYAEFYNTARPHRALDNSTVVLREATCSPAASVEDLACESWLGGVLRHYSWKGAA
jgi:putative transposase